MGSLDKSKTQIIGKSFSEKDSKGEWGEKTDSREQKMNSNGNQSSDKEYDEADPNYRYVEIGRKMAATRDQILDELITEFCRDGAEIWVDENLLRKIWNTAEQYIVAYQYMSLSEFSELGSYVEEETDKVLIATQLYQQSSKPAQGEFFKLVASNLDFSYCDLERKITIMFYTLKKTFSDLKSEAVKAILTPRRLAGIINRPLIIVANAFGDMETAMKLTAMTNEQLSNFEEITAIKKAKSQPTESGGKLTLEEKWNQIAECLIERCHKLKDKYLYTWLRILTEKGYIHIKPNYDDFVFWIAIFQYARLEGMTKFKGGLSSSEQPFFTNAMKLIIPPEIMVNSKQNALVIDLQKVIVLRGQGLQNAAIEFWSKALELLTGKPVNELPDAASLNEMMPYCQQIFEVELEIIRNICFGDDKSEEGVRGYLAALHEKGLGYADWSD